MMKTMSKISKCIEKVYVGRVDHVENCVEVRKNRCHIKFFSPNLHKVLGLFMYHSHQ